MSISTSRQRILLVGAGPMAQAHALAFKALNCDVTIVGRGEESAVKCEEVTGLTVCRGGLEAFIEKNMLQAGSFDAAVVATPIDTLANTAVLLLRAGITRLLLEKPAGLNLEQIVQVATAAAAANAQVYVAYNRRFYASALKAQELIAEDGGVTSFQFEFTEWSHVIEQLKTSAEIKASWLLANSTHVIDLAFYLGGHPAQFAACATGKLAWHAKAVYAGAGITDKGALFSYQANWAAPGRWGVELMTKKHRYIFRPIEELHIQNIGSVAVNKVEIDDSLDKAYKPGVYRQAQAFLDNDSSGRLLSLAAYVQLAQQIYVPISNGNNQQK